MDAEVPHRRGRRRRASVKHTFPIACPTSSLWSNASNELKIAGFGGPWRRYLLPVFLLPPARSPPSLGSSSWTLACTRRRARARASLPWPRRLVWTTGTAVPCSAAALRPPAFSRRWVRLTLSLIQPLMTPRVTYRWAQNPSNLSVNLN